MKYLVCHAQRSDVRVEEIGVLESSIERLSNFNNNITPYFEREISMFPWERYLFLVPRWFAGFFH
jgi:hypothetical protein